MKKQLIVGVEPDSIAHKLHIKKGDYLLTVNGETVRDIFDYRFLSADEILEFEIEKPGGKIKSFEIEKDYGQDLGLVFGQDLMDDYRSMPSSRLILGRPLLLLPPIPPSIKVFSNGSTVIS